MPQFDTFIFSSSLFYFIVSFFILLYCNFTQFLPRLSAILKLRSKISKKSVVISETRSSYQDYFSIFARALNVAEKN